MSTLFFRHLADADKAAALDAAIAAHNAGRPHPALFPVDPASFAQVPGSPFAYWVSERVRRLFVELPAFEGEGREVRLGDHPSDDFRYLRAAWEINFRSSTHDWVPYQKGGYSSKYYADIHLVVD